ncbi:MAG TPA: NAD-dependent epimerase/dehydratase family protein, partial [Opitutales bacterium]|nr:NAD-dependent epimerase/dehydratase family protein [Opitutales bacterium]
MATVIAQILAGRRELKLGNLTPTRDLTYVKDTAAGFVEIARCGGLVSQATQIGMAQEITME